MNRQFPEPQDVSCRCTALTLDYFRRSQLSTDELLEGLNYTQVDLQQPTAYIPWDDYLVFLVNCRKRLSAEQWRELFSSFQIGPTTRSRIGSNGTWLLSADSFRRSFDNGCGLSELYRCLLFQKVSTSSDQEMVDIQVAHGLATAPDCFWDSLLLTLQGSAASVGLISSAFQISWQRSERGARFVIAFPGNSVSQLTKSFLKALVTSVSPSQRNGPAYSLAKHPRQSDPSSRQVVCELALQESQSHLRLLMETAPEAILVYDVDDDRIIMANRNAEQLFENDRTALFLLSIHDLIQLSKQHEPTLSSTLEAVLSGKCCVLDFEYVRTGGDNTPCEARFVRLPSQARQLIRVSITDITDRKRTEAELVRARDVAVQALSKLQMREAELSVYTDRLQAAISLTNTGIFDHDHKSGEVYRSPEISRIYRLENAHSARPYFFLDNVPDEERAGLIQAITGSHDPQGDGSMRCIYRYCHPDKTVWIEARATTLFEEHDGRRMPVRTVGAIIDVSERIEREKSLEESQRQIAAILESTSDGVFSLDSNLRYLEFNSAHLTAMKRLYGAEITRGQRILDYLNVPQDFEIGLSCLSRALAGERLTMVQRFGNPQLRILTYELTYNPILDRAGKVSGVAIFARDLSETIRSQSALQEGEELRRLAIEVSQLGIWKLFIRRGKYSLDARCQQLFDLVGVESVDEFVIDQKIHPDDLPLVRDKLESLKLQQTASSVKFEFRVLGPQGIIRWLGACATKLINSGNRESCFILGTLLDVTEREHTSYLLAGSLQEKEALLNEIHHRVKNNLQVISSLLNLQAAEANSAEVDEFSIESQRRIRAMALVHETLYQTSSFAKIDLKHYIRQLCDYMFQSLGSSQAVISYQVDQFFVGLENSLSIGLILSELISNALKHGAIDSQTLLTITITVTRREKVIVVSVSDNGRGLPTDLELRKPKQFGLQLVQLLTRQLRGSISYSNLHGSQIQIEFPYDSKD